MTSEPVTTTNIYCEQRFTSCDGRRIALHRHPFGQPNEIWICDLGTLRICRIAGGRIIAANHHRDALYSVQTQGDVQHLIRINPQTFQTDVLHTFDGPDAAPGRNGTVSPDERWFVHGPYPEHDDHFSLRCLDLTTGQSETLCVVKDMYNPHAQFDPGDPGRLMVQVNRGGRIKRDASEMNLHGRIGATLHLVHRETGRVEPLPIGRPHTPRITGHECWLGRTGRLLFTAGQYETSTSSFVTLGEPIEAEQHMPPAAIYGLTPGDEQPHVVAKGLMFNHLAASDDGRFFVADHHATGRIYIGSIETGKYMGLCDSHTRQGVCQYSHVHAYMTPDNRHVIFNSIATGVAQTYAARVPDGFLDAVLAL